MKNLRDLDVCLDLLDYIILASKRGFEPLTKRLTAADSTIELLRIETY